MVQFLKDHPVWLTTLDILFHLMLFVAIVSVFVFTVRKPMRQYKSTDKLIFKKLQHLQTASNNKLMLVITFLGKHQFLIPANLILIILFFTMGTYHWYAFRLLIMSLSSLLLMFVLKRLFHRNRPGDPLLFQAKGKSFPSGHAMMSVTFYGLLLYMLLQTGMGPGIKIAISFFIILLILLIGFSRIYFHVHYASDVVAGFIIGICWFYTSLHILDRLENI